MLVTGLSVFNACALLVMFIVLLKFKHDLPDIEQVLVDVGQSISEELPKAIGSVLGEPQVKRAMSVLGKESGEVRADKALVKRVASQAMDQVPGIGLILKQFDLTPVEGLKLMNDPLIGPLIQRGIAAAQKGLGGLGKGFNSPGGGSFQGYRVEE